VLFQVRVNELASPERVRVTDKEHLRAFVAERVGDHHNVPALAMLRSAEDAEAFADPEECVIKPTHMSAEVIFGKKGSSLDRRRIAGWFKRNYYFESREANYRTLTPKVVVEPYIFGRVHSDVAPDYRINCVDGRARSLMVDLGVYSGRRRRAYFDTKWNLLPFTVFFPQQVGVPPPANLDEMFEVANRLASGFSFMRVDLYSDGTTILVGELTNCSGGAVTTVFDPPAGEEIVSRLLWPDRWAGR
jgi:hypothetical protein